MATVWVNDVPRQVAAGTRLSAVLSRSPHPCGGKGTMKLEKLRWKGRFLTLDCGGHRGDLWPRGECRGCFSVLK